MFLRLKDLEGRLVLLNMDHIVAVHQGGTHTQARVVTRAFVSTGSAPVSMVFLVDASVEQIAEWCQKS